MACEDPSNHTCVGTCDMSPLKQTHTETGTNLTSSTETPNDIQGGQTSLIIEINSLEELDATILRNANVVVYFYAPWCPSCKSTAPILESVVASGKFQDIVFYKVNRDTQKDAIAKMQIDTVPEVVMFRHGSIMVRLQAPIPRHGLENALRHHLAESGTEGRNTPRFIDPPSSKHEEMNYEQELKEYAHLNSLPVCTGDLPGKGKHNKRVPDPERNCVHTPLSIDDRLRIGKASDGQSSFAIMLLNDPRHPNTFTFTVAFMPDPDGRYRFESAMVSITFATYSPNENRVPLKILDISPVKANVIPTVRGNEDVTDGMSIVSSIYSDTESEDVIKPGATRVRGYGIGTATASWSFLEDKNLATPEGLIANQELSVTLPDAYIVCVTFWAKAVLEYQRKVMWNNKTTLELGSPKAPYERIVVSSKLGEEEGA